MRLTILSRKEELYSTRRLREAAARAGCETRVLDMLGCCLVVGKDMGILYHGRRLPEQDVVIARVGRVFVDYGVSVVRQFELTGATTLPCSNGISYVKDKFRTLQHLAQRGLPVPTTLIARYPKKLEKLLRLVGGTPVVLKLLQGSQGIGVMLAESAEAAGSVLDTLWGLGQNILMQEFVVESGGRDYRAFVIGGKVRASMLREARAGDFRANVHSGGSARACSLDPAEEALALKAAAALDLELCAVDFLRTSDGPAIIEVNCSPGLQAIEAATGVDLAALIIQHALSLRRASVASSSRT